MLNETHSLAINIQYKIPNVNRQEFSSILEQGKHASHKRIVQIKVSNNKTDIRTTMLVKSFLSHKHRKQTSQNDSSATYNDTYYEKIIFH